MKRLCPGPRRPQSAAHDGVDDARQSSLVIVGADVGRLRPDELIGGDALAGLGHAGETEVGAVSQNRGQKSVFIVVLFAGPHVGECMVKTGRARDLVEELGDAHPRHQTVDPRRKLLGRGGFIGAHRGDRELAVLEGDAFDLTALEAVCKLL